MARLRNAGGAMVSGADGLAHSLRASAGGLAHTGRGSATRAGAHGTGLGRRAGAHGTGLGRRCLGSAAREVARFARTLLRITSRRAPGTRGAARARRARQEL